MLHRHALAVLTPHALLSRHALLHALASPRPLALARPHGPAASPQLATHPHQGARLRAEALRWRREAEASDAAAATRAYELEALREAHAALAAAANGAADANGGGDADAAADANGATDASGAADAAADANGGADANSGGGGRGAPSTLAPPPRSPLPPPAVARGAGAGAAGAGVGGAAESETSLVEYLADALIAGARRSRLPPPSPTPFSLSPHLPLATRAHYTLALYKPPSTSPILVLHPSVCTFPDLTLWCAHLRPGHLVVPPCFVTCLAIT